VVSTLDERLAEVREGIMPNDVSEMAASHRRAFEAAANIAREVVAEKDAEIARLKAQMRDEVCTCCGRARKGFAREISLGEPVLPFEFTSEAPTVTTFDFGDGNGPVPAHKHPNGGGWVADTATVDDTAYVGPDARVFGKARVFGYAQVYGNARVFGKARVFGYAPVSETAAK
jgi:hypothetical protein